MRLITKLTIISLVSFSVMGQSSLTKGTTQYNLLDFPSAITQLENHVAKNGTENT